MAEAEIATPPPRRHLIMLTVSAVLVGLLFVFVGVLPAEYQYDPTRLGRLTGIDKLWAPPEVIVALDKAAAAPPSRSYPAPFRSDVVDIPLGSEESSEGSELEYKVHLRKGASYVYSWSVEGIANPEEFYTEFHGHTTEPGKAMVVAYYRKSTGTSDHGVLTAPFDGVHGWYFQNQSVKPVIVRLKLSGFYELIPDGEPGNEVGLHARAIALR